MPISPLRKRLLSGGALVGFLAVMVTVILVTPLSHASATEAQNTSRSMVEETFEKHEINYPGELHFRSSIVLGGRSISGYVPLLQESDAITVLDFATVDSHTDQTPEFVYESLALHEYGHILQKQLLEDRCGNSYSGRALCLPQLDSELAALPSPESTAELMPGLESNADCILITYMDYGNMSYLKDACSDEQLAAAWAVRSGEWPDGDAVERWLPHALKQAEAYEEVKSKNSKFMADVWRKRTLPPESSSTFEKP